jgi:hypothetical protein
MMRTTRCAGSFQFLTVEHSSNTHARTSNAVADQSLLESSAKTVMRSRRRSPANLSALNDKPESHERDSHAAPPASSAAPELLAVMTHRARLYERQVPRAFGPNKRENRKI